MYVSYISIYTHTKCYGKSTDKTIWMGWGLPIKARAKRSLLQLTGRETWLGPPCSTFFSTSYSFPLLSWGGCKSQVSKLNFRNPLQRSTNIHESREQCEQNPPNTDPVPGSRQLFLTLFTFAQLLLTLTMGIPALSLSLFLFFSLLLSSHHLTAFPSPTPSCHVYFAIFSAALSNLISPALAHHQTIAISWYMQKGCPTSLNSMQNPPSQHVLRLTPFFSTKPIFFFKLI